MKKSQLHALVREIVKQFNEVQTKEWELDGNNLIIDSEDDDGNPFTAVVELYPEKENSGIGSYEFHGQKGYHAGSDYTVFSDYRITMLNDFQITDSSQVPPEISKTIDGIIESNREAIEQQLGGM
jgi:hypothetical protein